MAFSVQTEKFRFDEELRDGFAGKRVLLTGAGKEGGLGRRAFPPQLCSWIRFGPSAA